MVYDDYADIGIFAKWVMDAPGIGERAHPSVGRRCPCTRKGIKLVLLTIIATSQAVFVWTFSNSQTFANFTSAISRRGLSVFRGSHAVSSAFWIGTDEKEPSFVIRLSVP